MNKIQGHEAKQLSGTAKKYADLEVAKMKGIDSKHCFCVNDNFVIGFYLQFITIYCFLFTS